ncbi:flagellar hook assembly protein FlgD [Massilia sp. W12]|uniref:flagellar hook assembly protein FlgD n=1 Tax=Massilia sp. W12 TaxID=3126507 RepID=UPI0030CA5E62
MANSINSVSDNLMQSMNPKSASAAKGTSAEEVQNRFLTLLVSQMKNQDPLSPMDNAQVTSQMAQLSTVTGIDKLNEAMKSLQDSYASTQSLQSASLIGHGVLTPGNQLVLDKGKAIFGVDIPEPADSVKVSIVNGSGQVLKSVDLGGQDVGVAPMTWDGFSDNGVQQSDGRYTIKVEAMIGDKKVESVQPLSFGMVSSITSGVQGVKVNVDGVGPVELSKVRQIL